MDGVVYRIRRDGEGTGGFLCPPGHPNHFYTINMYYPRGPRTPRPELRKEPDGFVAVDTVLGDDDNLYPDYLVAAARRLMERAELVYSSMWVRNVYGYFRNCYSPDGKNRNAGDCVIFKPHCLLCGRAPHPGQPGDGGHNSVPALRPPAHRHLAVMLIREYFPGHQPRTKLIENPGTGYGGHDCTRCGKRVQYEARMDALCEIITPGGPGGRWRYIADCPRGGRHQVGR
jgi:hypothetical protein